LKRTWKVALALAVAVACPAWGDLDKVDRRLLEHPPWESKQPLFALLALGPEAKSTAWLVVDGENAWLDRDLDGRLEAGEKTSTTTVVPNVVEFEKATRAWTLPDLPSGPTAMRLEQAFLNPDWMPADDASNRKEMALAMERARARQEPFLASLRLRAGKIDWQLMPAFGSSPELAPVLHVDGPLTLGFVESALGPLVLWRGAEREVSIGVGAAGRGPASFAYRFYEGIPEDRKPTLEIRFPTAAGGHGDPVRFVLPDRC
jgi:hypothetical protein